MTPFGPGTPPPCSDHSSGTGCELPAIGRLRFVGFGSGCCFARVCAVHVGEFLATGKGDVQFVAFHPDEAEQLTARGPTCEECGRLVATWRTGFCTECIAESDRRRKAERKRMDPTVTNARRQDAALLGCRWPCTAQALTRAWRDTAKRLHPDVAGGDAGKFASAREAYERLAAVCAARTKRAARARKPKAMPGGEVRT